MTVERWSESVLRSKPEEADSLCLMEEGGGGRRGTRGAESDSDRVG